MIKVEHLFKSFDDKPVLKDINADFEAILKECENKEASIASLKEYVAVLDKL